MLSHKWLYLWLEDVAFKLDNFLLTSLLWLLLVLGLYKRSLVHPI